MQALLSEFENSLGAYQRLFHQRWNHLNDPHVRALAWLLDSPDLLDPLAPQWCGKIASISDEAAAFDQSVIDWLASLDRAPDALHAALNAQYCARLGRYAEKLMAFYFQHKGNLVAHGVQVRAAKNNTIGEFDFLLRRDQGLVHWEFATKFYLLAQSGVVVTGRLGADYFVGPNLADSLGAKMRKILDQQLSLAQHPAAQAHLPDPVVLAQALVKGWLFYHRSETRKHAIAAGVAASHCHGFWCGLSEWELDVSLNEQYVILPRLDWLAPAKVLPQISLCKAQLQASLINHFAKDTMPVLVATLQRRGDWMLESDRGFIVPDDWSNRAEERLQQG